MTRLQVPWGGPGTYWLGIPEGGGRWDEGYELGEHLEFPSLSVAISDVFAEVPWDPSLDVRLVMEDTETGEMYPPLDANNAVMRKMPDDWPAGAWQLMHTDAGVLVFPWGYSFDDEHDEVQTIEDITGFAIKENWEMGGTMAGVNVLRPDTTQAEFDAYMEEIEQP